LEDRLQHAGKKFHLAASGDTCGGIVSKYGVFTLTQFYAWNPAVGNGNISAHMLMSLYLPLADIPNRQFWALVRLVSSELLMTSLFARLLLRDVESAFADSPILKLLLRRSHRNPNNYSARYYHNSNSFWAFSYSRWNCRRL
jgi:hypothetical protein